MPEGLPRAVGTSYKPQHHAQILSDPGPVRWFEIHAENYMGAGGPQIARLRALRERFAVSCHGVGLSIGGVGALDQEHLGRLRHLLDWLKPAQFSEHLAWSSHEGHFLNDLLPLPYTGETLARVAAHIDEVQEHLGRQMLLENPSSYLTFAQSDWSEADFLAEVARRTGCGLLLDVNNVFVSATNLQTSPEAYLDDFPCDLVGEIHLGGHAADADESGAPLLIDSHDAPVADPVWALFARALARTGPVPVLIEWDNDLPEWPVLAGEAHRAASCLAQLADGPRHG